MLKAKLERVFVAIAVGCIFCFLAVFLLDVVSQMMASDCSRQNCEPPLVNYYVTAVRSLEGLKPSVLLFFPFALALFPVGTAMAVVAIALLAISYRWRKLKRVYLSFSLALFLMYMCGHGALSV
jgi:hypothetical protein